MQNKIHVFFDIETDSLRNDCQIIQLAAVAMQNSTQLGQFEIKLDFNRLAADPEALRINGYTNEAWANCVPPTTAVIKFSQFLEPFKTIKRTSKNGNEYRVAQLAGYNAHAFDGPRLIKLFSDCGAFLPANYRVLDVMQLAMWYYEINGNPPANFKLATVCDAFGIGIANAHDALCDVMATAQLAHLLTLALS